LGPAAEVLVVGDLHGNVENFRKVLERAQLGKFPEHHLVLQELIHGPFRYPGGGDKSHQLLDLLAALKCQYPGRVHMLLGNHELSEWTGQAIAKGLDELPPLFREGIDTAYGDHASAIYAAYCELFAVVPLAVRTANRVFLSHSLPSPSRLQNFDPAVLEEETHAKEDLEPGGAVHALVWGRNTQSATATAFLQKVDSDLLITGHIPCPRGFEAANERQIILDAMGAPACYCLFPTDCQLTLQDLLNCIGTL